MAINLTPEEDILFIKYLQNRCASDEKLQVEKWIAKTEENKEYFDTLKKTWNATNTSKDFEKIDLETGWTKIQNRIEDTQEKKSYTLKPFIKWAAAASILLLAYIGSRVLDNDTQTIIATKQNKEFVLPDGSTVWLYKGSELTYAKNFEEDSRTLSLKGEGFFKVTKDPDRPFVISTNNTKTTVLGTAFNLKQDLKNKTTELVLVEGSVQFNTKTQKQILIPGEKITADVHGNLTKQNNDTTNFDSWRTKILRFSNTPLKKVIKNISHAYQKDIILQDETLLNCTLNTEFNNESLDQILETLQILYQMEYEYRDGVYYITSGVCKSEHK